MTEPRPHRAPLDPGQASRDLRAEVVAGRLDSDAVDAVLAAAGHRAPARRTWPGGLTAREVEVLGLLARGHSNREIGQRLVVTPKTAANHVEHIYAKLGVSGGAPEDPEDGVIASRARTTRLVTFVASAFSARRNEAVMTLRSRFFAMTYDRQIARAEKAGLRAYREGVLADANGRVLEIGGGTGANLRFYGPAVESLTLTEPETPMLRRLERKARAQAPAATVLRAPAEDLPFDDDTFDVAVSTLVLCGVNDQPRALRELRRVLRPGGQLLFIEHVRSTDPELARFQDRMNGINRFVVGCDCNRPTLDSLQEAGFTITQVEHTTLPKAPKFARPAIVGSATAPASVPSRDAQLATGARP
jgi:ubiquinone/menaquinone biosynthesis C-methylase UbiE/DNA-binding CsgD family transcriptional regulator